MFLSDDMSVTLAFSRFRSRDFRLLAVIRRIASYALARDVRVSVRWIPCEYSPVGRYSRYSNVEEVKNIGTPRCRVGRRSLPHATVAMLVAKSVGKLGDPHVEEWDDYYPKEK